ncbi:hypothetical protein [Celeribacter sp. PS-C1]|uniref:hypothetical protein n=1 Tax=Celeribacter sp. PS-C1 TaxID=2820813 RepID=UPI001CA47192|nr:hypothetical protein [Celeribacter sp. PS-C1]MBW6417209.1 hypothetical protein [Celeribacter sp. PS-C1]
MIKTSLLAITGATVALAGAAQAQEITYGSADLSYYSVEDADVLRLQGDVDYMINRFSFTGTAKAVDYDGIDLYTLNGTIGYEITPGFTGYVKLGAFDFPYGDTEYTYGLGVDYIGNAFGVAFEYTTVDDADFETYNLNGYYAFGASTVFGSASSLDGEFSIYGLGYDYDAGMFGASVSTSFTEDGFDYGFTSIAGRYDFGQFGVKANVLTVNDDMFDDGFFGIAGTYAVNDAVSIEIGYDTSFGDVVDMDIFSLSVTYEMGGERARVTDRVSDLFDKSRSNIFNIEAFDIYEPIYGPGVFGPF